MRAPYLLMDLFRTGLFEPVWCTSWREDATTMIGPILGLPTFPYVDLPRSQITTSHPNGYLWKRDHVAAWLGDAPGGVDRRRLHGPRPRVGHTPHGRGPPHAPHPTRSIRRPAARAPRRRTSLGGGVVNDRREHPAKFRRLHSHPCQGRLAELALGNGGVLSASRSASARYTNEPAGLRRCRA